MRLKHLTIVAVCCLVPLQLLSQEPKPNMSDTIKALHTQMAEYNVRIAELGDKAPAELRQKASDVKDKLVNLMHEQGISKSEVQIGSTTSIIQIKIGGDPGYQDRINKFQEELRKATSIKELMQKSQEYEKKEADTDPFEAGEARRKSAETNRRISELMHEQGIAKVHYDSNTGEYSEWKTLGIDPQRPKPTRSNRIECLEFDLKLWEARVAKLKRENPEEVARYQAEVNMLRHVIDMERQMAKAKQRIRDAMQKKSDDIHE